MPAEDSDDQIRPVLMWFAEGKERPSVSLHFHFKEGIPADEIMKERYPACAQCWARVMTEGDA